MDRRHLLMLGATGGFSTLGPLPELLAKEKDSRIRIAVKYSMIQEPVDATGVAVSVLEKFGILKSADFDGVEITIAQQKDLREILRGVDATGVAVHGVVHGSSDNYQDAQ